MLEPPPRRSAGASPNLPLLVASSVPPSAARRGNTRLRAGVAPTPKPLGIARAKWRLMSAPEPASPVQQSPSPYSILLQDRVIRSPGPPLFLQQ